jgi:hypothetical protein
MIGWISADHELMTPQFAAASFKMGPLGQETIIKFQVLFEVIMSWEKFRDIVGVTAYGMV